jgi:hypothetical protein
MKTRSFFVPCPVCNRLISVGIDKVLPTHHIKRSSHHLVAKKDGTHRKIKKITKYQAKPVCSNSGKIVR